MWRQPWHGQGRSSGQGPVGMGTQGGYSPGSRGRPLGRCCRTGRAWALSVETPGRGKGCQENWKGGEGRGGFRRGEGQQGELALGTHWMWWAGPDVGSQGTPRWPEHPHPQPILAVSAPEPGRPGGCPIPVSTHSVGTAVGLWAAPPELWGWFHLHPLRHGERGLLLGLMSQHTGRQDHNHSAHRPPSRSSLRTSR